MFPGKVCFRQQKEKKRTGTDRTCTQLEVIERAVESKLHSMILVL